MAIYLVRHGQTTFNAAGRHHGHADAPLTALGERQARGVARALSGLADPAETLVVSSPLGRARRTAAIIAGALVLLRPVEEDADLMEIGMGSAEGMTQAEMAARWPRLAASGMALEAPDGERLEAVWVRVARALARLAVRPERPCIVVAHGISGRLLLGRHLGLPLSAASALEMPQEALFRLDAQGATRIAVRPD